jgi:hypothetical protein
VKEFVRLHFSGKKLGVVVHICHPSDGKKLTIGEPWYRPSWAKSKILSPKKNRAKRLEV